MLLLQRPGALTILQVRQGQREFAAYLGMGHSRPPEGIGCGISQHRSGQAQFPGSHRRPAHPARLPSGIAEVNPHTPSPIPEEGCWAVLARPIGWVVYISCLNSCQPWGITSQNHVAILTLVPVGLQSAALESPQPPCLLMNLVGACSTQQPPFPLSLQAPPPSPPLRTP